MDIIWKDRKRNIFGMPLSFTVYKLSNRKLYIDKGFFKKKYSEVKLYRIVDLEVNQTIMQRIFGIGTIHCVTTDSKEKDFDIKNIRKALIIKEIISDMVDEDKKNNIVMTESVNYRMLDV